MTQSRLEARSVRRPRRIRFTALLAVAGISGAAIAALTSLAFAKGPMTVGVAKNVKVKTKTENIVVNSRGLTVYTLSSEKTHPLHLTCTKASGCLNVWFPVKASAKGKLTAPSGVKGKLGRLHRGAVLQLTLGGKPLYTFKFDNKTKRMTNGEGIPSFGGVWHVVKAAATKHSPTHTTTTTTSTTMTSTTTTGPYGY